MSIKVLVGFSCQALLYTCTRVLRHLIPYRNASYLGELLRSMGRNRVRAGALFCLLLYHSGHFLYLQARTLDFESRLLHADYIHFVLVPQTYVSLSIISVLSAYLYLKLYLRPDPDLRALCCWLANAQQIHPGNAHFACALKACRFGRGVMLGLQPFLVLLEFSVFISHYSCWPHMVRLYVLGPNGPKLGRVMLHLTNTLLNDIALFAFCQVCTVVTVLGAVMFAYLFIRLEQNLEYLRLITKTTTNRRRRKIDWQLQLNRFVRRDIRNLSLLFMLDRCVGQWFLVFMLLSTPSNAFLCVLSLVVRMPFVKHFLIGCIIAYQLMAIAGIHLVLAQFTQAVHRSAGPLLRMAVLHRFGSIANRNGNDGRDFNAHFRLAITVERVHCTHKYGVHYGAFGLISIYSFAKLLLFYGKLMIYSYKLIVLIHDDDG